MGQKGKTQARVTGVVLVPCHLIEDEEELACKPRFCPPHNQHHIVLLYGDQIYQLHTTVASYETIVLARLLATTIAIQYGCALVEDAQFFDDKRERTA